jgi:hypothetical protein
MADRHSDDRRITIAILERVVDLGNQLRVAFDQEPQLPLSVEKRRERLSAGVRVVAKFVQALVGPKYADPFDELSSVLADLNAGAWPELAVPANYGTRRSDPSEIWRARANVVLAKRISLLGGGCPMCLRNSRQDITASRAWPGPRLGICAVHCLDGARHSDRVVSRIQKLRTYLLLAAMLLKLAGGILPPCANLREIACSGQGGCFPRGSDTRACMLEMVLLGGPDDAATSQTTCEPLRASIH